MLHMKFKIHAFIVVLENKSFEWTLDGFVKTKIYDKRDDFYFDM